VRSSRECGSRMSAEKGRDNVNKASELTKRDTTSKFSIAVTNLVTTGANRCTGKLPRARGCLYQGR
jgi:hypothetical protein